MQKKILILICLIVTILCSPNSWANEHDAEPKVYNFGVITLTHPLIIYRQYLPFVDYLNDYFPWDFKLVLYKEYAEVENAIKSGKLDMALFGGNSFARTIESTSLYPVVSVLSSDKTTKTYSVIVARADDTRIKSVQDLHGKSMAFGPAESTSSFIIPAQYLNKQGINLQDFAFYKNLNSHDAVLRSVLRGEFDAGAIGEAFAQRFLEHGIKIIGNTQKFPSFIIVAGSSLPEKIRINVQELLLAIDAESTDFIRKSKDWPEILRNGFAPVLEKDYEVFQDISMEDLNNFVQKP